MLTTQTTIMIGTSWVELGRLWASTTFYNFAFGPCSFSFPVFLFFQTALCTPSVPLSTTGPPTVPPGMDMDTVASENHLTIPQTTLIVAKCRRTAHSPREIRWGSGNLKHRALVTDACVPERRDRAVPIRNRPRRYNSLVSKNPASFPRVKSPYRGPGS